jgi:sugar O-acyltransferase (sialic acid O-acetyltransferase NeuD family)
MNLPEIAIFGASGHAKVVIDIIERAGLYHIAAIFDDNEASHGKSFFGYVVKGGREALLASFQRNEFVAMVVAIGNNQIRVNIADWLHAQGISRVSCVHPSVQLGRGVQIGLGSVLMAGVVVNADTLIGNEVIINTGATIDHDNVIADAVHVAPGCNLCGHVSVGRASMIGAGSIVIPSVQIGEQVVVGAGSTVIANVADGLRVAGSPCRVI